MARGVAVDDERASAERAPATIADDTRNDDTTRPVRVLAMDDDQSIRELFIHALGSMQGYEVVIAADGAEGLQLFYRLRPDCVILDVQMPMMNGFQVLRAIRGDPASANVPVIILSVRAEEAYQRTGAYSGVDEYLPKPFKLNDLRESIARVLRITAEERERRMQRLADAVDGVDGDKGR